MLNVIDVSVYQPDIDYAAVKAAGIDGAVLRCGFTGWGSSHSLNKDTKFEAHYAGFTGAGVPVGAYYYSTADSVDFAKKEAGFVQSLLKGKKLALPVYYDIENNERQAALSMSLLTQIAEAFCESMEEAGYFVGVYANTNWFTNKLNHAALSEKYTVWLADYRGANANKTLQRDMWQYTSTGKVNGINGNVDLNECYRDFPSIIKAAGLNGYAKEAGGTPAPAPEPESGGTYTVKAGDSWWKIAEEQLGDGSRYKELAAYNGKTAEDTIYAGQKLKLPGKGASAQKTYTVKAGDSWWKIAEEQMGNGMQYAELASYNGKTAASVIHPGDVIKMS